MAGLKGAVGTSIYGRSAHHTSKPILPQQLAPPIPSSFVEPAKLVWFPSIRRRLPPVFFLPPTISSPLIHSYHYTRSRLASPLDPLLPRSSEAFTLLAAHSSTSAPLCCRALRHQVTLGHTPVKVTPLNRHHALVDC